MVLQHVGRFENGAATATLTVLNGTDQLEGARGSGDFKADPKGKVTARPQLTGSGQVRPNQRWMRVVPNSALSAASACDGPVQAADGRLAAQERDVDLRHLVVAELEVADAAAVVARRPPTSPRMRALIASATTAAWPSANTPAFGVPTLVTSPTA